MGHDAVAEGSASAAPKKLDAIRIVTRCTDVEQFLTMFRRFCTPTSCFIPSLTTRPVGMETAFSIRLADQTPVMRGLGVVLAAWNTADNPFGRPGVHLGIQRLAPESLETFQRLLIPRMARSGSKDTIPNSAPSTIEASVPVEAAKTEEMPPLQPPKVETRTPGSSTVLPANPLTDMNDDSLGAFVDCELREVETDESLSIADLGLDSVIPNNPVALAAAAAVETVLRPGVQTTLGVAPHAPVKVYAAPEPVMTELVDKVASQVSPMFEPMPPPPGPWLAEFLQRWWLATAVALGLIAIVVVAAIVSSTTPDPVPVVVELPPPPKPAPPVPQPPPPVQPAVAAGPCKLTVTTRPEGAQVRIDSKPVGAAPVTVDGPCARRRVEAMAPRWQTAAKWVVVEAESEVAVTLSRPKHALTVRSTPTGSTVTINGKQIGSTPATTEITGFESLAIVVEKPGYKTYRKKHKSTRALDQLEVKLAK